MPHKHKRKRDEDPSNFDLAPNTKARPLAAYNKASLFSTDDAEASNKRRKPNPTKSKRVQDDTPKAFARLMAWQAAGKKPNGLDEGNSAKPAKKQTRRQAQQIGSNAQTADTKLGTTSSERPVSASKQKAAVAAAAAAATTVNHPPSNTNTDTNPIPKILPGESLANFALRVDQSLPLTSITRTNNSATPKPSLPEDLQAKLKQSQRTTRHNKRLQRMQAEWRAEEAKLKDKEAEQDDELEEQREEESLLWASVRPAKASKKAKKKRVGGGGSSSSSGVTSASHYINSGVVDDDDPWKDLEKKRREATKQKNLQDVVLAPPVLKKMTKSKFKTRDEDFEAVDGKQDNGEPEGFVVDVGSVPNAVGSLRRREELNATRKAVIEGYRTMHGRKRGVGERLSMSQATVI